jgi:hypothetical protein
LGPYLLSNFPNVVGMKNNILFYIRDEELVCVDLKTKMIKELGVRGCKFYFHVGIID